ncbi:MAG: PASTA domain-containing protein [Oscillospiraceae bacterium]|nr:PASTA domain-containing protein [Oscillospiraceae bacterium]
MKNQDLLDAIGAVSDKAVRKYALPEDAAQVDSDAAPVRGARIMQQKKKPFRIRKGTVAAAIAVCVGLNAALIYGISRMRQDDGIGIPAAESALQSAATQQAAAELTVSSATPTTLHMTVTNRSGQDLYFGYSLSVMQGGQEVLTVAQPTETHWLTYAEDGAIQLQPSLSEPLDKHILAPEETSPEITVYLVRELDTEVTDLAEAVRQRSMEAGDYTLRVPVRIGAPDAEVIYLEQPFTIAAEQPVVQLPDFRNARYENVREQLSDLDLFYTAEEIPDETVPAGAVVRTEPEAPAELHAGDFVCVYVSTGSAQELPDIPAPDFVNQHIELAKTMAAAMGLELAINVTEVPAGSKEEGLVLSQDIPAGEPVPAGTVITLEVAGSGAEKQKLRLTFQIPADMDGLYHFEVRNDQDQMIESGASFRPEYFAGSTSVTVSGSEQEQEVRVYLVREDTGKSSLYGTYLLHFPEQSIETVFEDAESAFQNVQ